MVAIGKMNKTELIARVQELEKQIEGWQEVGAQYGDAFETPQDIVYLIENTKAQVSDEIIKDYFANEKLRETSWKEWKNMEEEVKFQIGEYEKRLEDAEHEAKAWEDSNNEKVEEIKELKKENEELEEDVYDPSGSGEKCVDILNTYREEMEKIEEYSVKKLEKRLEDITDILPELVGLEGKFNDQQKHIGNLKKFLEEEKEKVSVFETYMNSDDGSDSIMTLINNFNEWVTNVEVKKGKNFHFQLEEDAETGEFVLKVLKDIPAKIEMWERVMESGDGDPELLLDAIAEKLNLTPIEWGKAGCGQKAAELWDKVIDTMEEI
jgi:DNA repair exonuclease SbcCD ATPase subunit